jgi:hypothetical protein
MNRVACPDENSERTGKLLRGLFVPELEADGAVLEVHRLGQKVDPDRRLQHRDKSKQNEIQQFA